MQVDARAHRRGGFWLPMLQSAATLKNARKEAFCNGVMPPIVPGQPRQQLTPEPFNRPANVPALPDRGDWYPPTRWGGTELPPIAEAD